MKKISFLVSSLAISIIGFAQPETKDMSPAEGFAARKGTTLEKRFDEVGKIGMLNVQIEYITDLNTNDKMQCVRFDIDMKNGSTGPSALLDSNEVNDIIGFLKYITTAVIIKPPVDPNTEISFTTKYNIQVGCFWQSNNGWSVFLRTDAQNPGTEADFFHSDIVAVMNTLRLANTNLHRY